MKISTEIESASNIIGEEKAIEYIAKAGFDAWDFSMFAMCKYDWGKKALLENNHPLASNNYLAFARRLKRIGNDYGIICNQSHAPFPSSCPEIRSYFKRAIECTAEAGGKICIIHPDNDKSAQENAEMRGSGSGAAAMIYALGGRVQALHIHDNDKWHDSHQIPFSMSMDFSAVVKALKDINYQGYFTLEADSYLKKYSADNVFEGIKNLAAADKRLADMYEAE